MHFSRFMMFACIIVFFFAVMVRAYFSSGENAWLISQGKGLRLRAARKDLEHLKTRLPKLIVDWCKKQGSVLTQEKVKVRVLRFVSPNEAKMTLLIDDYLGSSLVSLYLSYYDTAWTITRYESVLVGSLQGFEDKIPYLLLAIDEKEKE